VRIEKWGKKHILNDPDLTHIFKLAPFMEGRKS